MPLLDDVFAAGIVGAGGAGFPTHKKLAGTATMLIANGAECEPLLASDRYVMRSFADEIVAGLAWIAEELGISTVVIGTKRKYVDEIAALRTAISEAGAPITIHELDGFYPAGDEQVLIYEITGKTVPPGGIPIALGIVVVNVTTALNVARSRQGTPVTRRYVTVNGEVAHPVIVDAPVGTTPADLIAAAGGVTVADYELVRGGPMMGRQFTSSESSAFGYGKADGGLLVLRSDNPVFIRGHKPVEHIMQEAKSTCIQCQMCTELCPRYLIGHQMRPHRVMRSVGLGTHAEDLMDAMLCCECGVCELFSCPMGLSPRQVNIQVKAMLRQAGARIEDTTIHPEQCGQREYRRVAQSRLIERLGLDSYPNHLHEVRVCEPDRVLIPVKHGVGKPSSPVVAVGDLVTVGQVIAKVEPDDVGCLVHASIDGQVSDITPAQIVIERDRR